MTDQRELDRLLGAFFVEGTDELADRVIDAALDHIEHIPQRRALRAPWRFQTMPMFTRVAAAAVIGVLAVGGAFYLIQPGKPAVGGPSPTPTASPSQPSASQPAVVIPSPTPSVSPSAVAPTWTATGGITQERVDNTATMLPGGKVLVTGGTASSPGGLLASAQLYDPVSRTWTATGSMVSARMSHTATLLPDGKVLVTGGNSGNATGSSLASAELYDPGTGSWTAAGSLVTPRQYHTATLLPDGKVLVTGGTGANEVPGEPTLASAELYDPVSRTWTATASMVSPRKFHVATLLPDGKVLVTGGTGGVGDACCVVLASAELFDPGSRTWTATGGMVSARESHTATLLPDGKVLVAGGDDGTGIDRAELYDPSSGSWTATAGMVAPRNGHTATLLPDGMVLVAGGFGTGPTPVAAAELYDPGSGSWVATASMVTPRQGHTATLLPDGKVLVAGGGALGVEAPVLTAELYDPGSGN